MSDTIRAEIVDLALRETKLSPRELAVRLTDEKSYLRSEASSQGLLRAHDLITSPAWFVIKAASNKTTAPNQLGQTGFTCLKITGWGWDCLSTVLDGLSRSIVAWTRSATMRADDVTAMVALGRQVAAFVEYSNDARYHERLGNLTPAGVWRGRGQAILTERDRIKRPSSKDACRSN